MLVALADYRDQGTEVADTSVEENQTEPSRPEASATESQKPSVTPNQPNPQPAAPPTRNDPTKLVIAQSSKRSPLNLGGKQVKTASVDFKPKVGEPLHTNIPWYSRIFSDAYASRQKTELSLACISTAIQDDGQIGVRADDFHEEVGGESIAGMNLNGLIWTDKVNSDLIVLENVSVDADGNPTSSVKVQVFPNYNGDPNALPSISAFGAVTTTAGKEALLYRIFMSDDAWPIRCMDIVFRPSPNGTLADGTLYHENSGHLYVSKFKPTLIKGG
jgi:hypothetical protein